MESIAILFKKVYEKIIDDITIWKPISVIEGEKDYVDETLYLIGYYPCLNYSMSSTEACGYAITMDELEKIYPNVKDKEKLKQNYLEEASLYLYMTTYEDGEIFQNRFLYDDIKDAILNSEEWPNTIDENECDFGGNVSSNLNTKKGKTSLKNEENDIQEKSFYQGMDGISKLVGLTDIKTDINRWIQFLKFYSKVAASTNLESPKMHMAFLGNPGTGKTTVARIIASILYGLGYLKSKDLVETTPGDFISNHIGETAIKTKEILQKHRGKLILIDEAYAFSLEYNHFAEEALVEILKEMERSETIFIMAGYQTEMKKLIEMNPGLASRICNYYKFPDYTLEELLEIWQAKLKKHGFTINFEANNIVKKILEMASQKPNFGNARYIDKLFDKALFNHAVTMENVDDIETLKTFCQEDFSDIVEQLNIKEKVKTIGFKI